MKEEPKNTAASTSSQRDSRTFSMLKDDLDRQRSDLHKIGGFTMLEELVSLLDSKVTKL